MNKLNHKIVCWGDYAIPVDEKYKWMAFDPDGSLCFYGEEPFKERSEWTGSEYWMNSSNEYYESPVSRIIPPEPGPWNEQLYNIE